MALIVVSAVLISLVGCSVFFGGKVVTRQRAELVLIERNKRAAERRIHDLSRQAVAEMLIVARHTEPADYPWPE